MNVFGQNARIAPGASYRARKEYKNRVRRNQCGAPYFFRFLEKFLSLLF